MTLGHHLFLFAIFMFLVGIHANVCGYDQILKCFSIRRELNDTVTETRIHLAVARHDWNAHHLIQDAIVFFRQSFRRGPEKDPNELIPAITGNHIAFTGVLFQLESHLDDGLISNRMTVSIIDDFQIIDVKQDKEKFLVVSQSFVLSISKCSLK